MAEVLAERGGGLDAVTLADVAAHAGVPVGAVSELFADREACMLAAFELGVERIGAEMARAYGREPRWLDGVKAALARFLRFLEVEPALGRVLVVYSTAGGARVLRRRVEVQTALASVIDRGRAEAPTGAHQPPAIVAEGVVGAVLAVVQNRLLTEDSLPPMDLFGSLISIVVLPYLGAGVARRELTRPAPRLRDELEDGFSGQLGDWRGGTRITYRTARVLSAIDDYPGASNREVAERAGIVDQGQISKLLARLQESGLIEKAGEIRTRGAPNSWRMTERGKALMRTAGMRAAVRSSQLPRE
ncbi:MAG: MarR family transcriptional regulator [Solirubrobacteraceae bacterium]